MKKGDVLWTRDQLTLVINLYNKITFGQMHSRNPAIIALAGIIDRKPNAVAMKLVNFASLDPRLKQKGMTGASNLDKLVWQEFSNDWAEQIFESEKLLAKKTNSSLEKLYDIDLDNLKQREGKDVERVVKTRVNQERFREAVFTNFNNQCCISGIGITGLLVASHIVPWSGDTENRLNPQNGLSLNALLDRAFDNYLITVTTDLKVKVSSRFHKHKDVLSIKQNFIDYDGKSLIEPKKFYPDVEFLKMHNDKFIV